VNETVKKIRKVMEKKKNFPFPSRVEGFLDCCGESSFYYSIANTNSAAIIEILQSNMTKTYNLIEIETVSRTDDLIVLAKSLMSHHEIEWSFVMTVFKA
jgi:hypothetical protein